MSFVNGLKIASVAATLVLSTPTLYSQEGLAPTQTLVLVDSKNPVTLDSRNIKLELNGKVSPVTGLRPVPLNGVQIALLIDDGLRRSVASQLNDMKAFFESLPPGAEVLVGYMENGTVRVAQPFTADHAAAVESLRIPFGEPGMSASPYFCLSDFVKKWPAGSSGKARFAIMLTNGVDPYNGSTRMSNQDSPYVQEAIDDANRAGVAVYSIYYGDSGMRTFSANVSGQSYLNQVAGSTGAEAFYEGAGSPISIAPYFRQFLHDISETYIVSFVADANRKNHDLVQVKMSSDIPKLKLRHPDAVRPGNVEAAQP
jgi:hypothetical protein